MNPRADAIVAASFLVLGIVILVASITLPSSNLGRDAVGPAGLPAALALILMVGGSIQVARALRWARRDGGPMPPEGAGDDGDHPISQYRPLAFIGGSLTYAAMMQPIGYLVATPLFLGAALWAMNFRRWWLVALSALGFTVVTFVVFSQYLGVPVPVGVLNDVLVALGIIEDVR